MGLGIVLGSPSGVLGGPRLTSSKSYASSTNDIPINREKYTHRIGRSGRFGRKGVAINFVAERDIRYLRDIEEFYSTKVVEMTQHIDQRMQS